MAADPTASPDGDAPRLTWRERELVTALRRLANSQAQVRALEEAQRQGSPAARPAPGDVELVELLQRELERLRAKASSRFGGGSARDKLPDVEEQQRLALERLGFESYDRFVAGGRRPAPPPDAVEPAILDFARKELAAAEDAYAALLALPDDESPIDLTRGEGA